MVAMLKREMASLKTGPARLATTNDARTRGQGWQAARARTMRQANGLCQPCQLFGHVTMGAECDHIRPLWAGGSDRQSNLQWICWAHHRAKSQSEEKTRKAGAAWQPWQPGPLKARD
jgi:5-methylcytosine-specific restriction endonuclease McrA